MARIALVTPAGAGTGTGNRHTALRWAAFLRRAGHRVSVALAWDGAPCDLLLALHARRSHNSIAQYRSMHPRGPPAGVFRVAVIGHLREEKDPFRAAAALARLPQEPAIEVVHVGAALSADM